VGQQQTDFMHTPVKKGYVVKHKAIAISDKEAALYE
jgi:hypothetical protein